MKQTNNCVEIINIDSEIARLDKLTGVYNAEIQKFSTSKASLLARKNSLVTAGCCTPIEKSITDPLSGNRIGTTYEHAHYCKRKGDKLEVK